MPILTLLCCRTYLKSQTQAPNVSDVEKQAVPTVPLSRELKPKA
ncbi:hypothetical protein [Maritalea myrionectae]|nr:hypothetical protein [Maritalea myrionectae]